MSSAAMEAAMAAMTDAVAATEGVEESAAEFITRVAGQMTENKEDPAAIQALADRLVASKGSLAAAIAAVPGDTSTEQPQA